MFGKQLLVEQTIFRANVFGIIIFRTNFRTIIRNQNKCYQNNYQKSEQINVVRTIIIRTNADRRKVLVPFNWSNFV
jgi:hypothetical protein